MTSKITLRRCDYGYYWIEANGDWRYEIRRLPDSYEFAWTVSRVNMADPGFREPVGPYYTLKPVREFLRRVAQKEARMGANR